MKREEIGSFIDTNSPERQDKKEKTDGVSIYEELRKTNENLLDRDFILEIKKQEGLFEGIIELTEKDLEMLMVLYRFDRDTFKHSLRTLSIIKEKVHKPLRGGIVIADGIKKEVADLEVFYRACLLHDIGKIAIPKFVLNNNLKDEEWAEHLINIINNESDSQIIKENIAKYGDEQQADIILEELKSISAPLKVVELLNKYDLRPCKIVPVRYGLEKEEVQALQDTFNIDPNLPLWLIVNKHEEESSNILKSKGFEKEAKLAGDHGKKVPKETPIASTSLRIGSRMSDVKDLVYLGDVHDALLSKRKYKNPINRIEAMAHLVIDAEKGKIDKVVTYLWIEDDMEILKLSEEGKKILEIIERDDESLSPKEIKLKNNIKKNLPIVEEFLKSLDILRESE